MRRINPPLIPLEGSRVRVAPRAAQNHGWLAAFRFLGLVAVAAVLFAGPGMADAQVHAQPATPGQPATAAPAVHHRHHRVHIKRVRRRVHHRRKRAKTAPQNAASGHTPAAPAGHAPAAAPHVAAASPAHAPVVHPPAAVVHPPDVHPKVAAAPAAHAPAIHPHAAAPVVQTAAAHAPDVPATIAPVHHHLTAPNIHRETVHIHSAEVSAGDHTSGPAAPVTASAASQAPATIAAVPEKPKWPAFDHPTDASVLWDSHGLTIDAANSSLQQILKDVSTATGVKVEGLSSDERVFGTYGPGLARDVLSELLQGSGYNMIMVGDLGQGAPRRIMLSIRQAVVRQPAVRTGNTSPSSDAEDEEPEEQPNPQEPPIRPGFQPGGPPRSPQQIMQEMQQRQQRMQEQQEQQLPQQPQN